MILKVPF
jgi:hypothetical protein